MRSSRSSCRCSRKATSSSTAATRSSPTRSGAARISKDKGIHFVGCGVSGGEEGALKGPSLMPGGSRESWEMIAPIFRKIAAQVDGEPCCRYMGPDGAGHYVKMVHNGIEYGDMQLICEAYAILEARPRPRTPTSWPTFSPSGTRAISTAISSRSPRRFFAKTIPKPASRWSTSSSTRPAKKGPASGRCNRPSSNRSSSPPSTPRSKRASFPRAKTSGSRPRKFCRSRRCRKFSGDRDELIQAVRDALYASKIVSYAQGMELLGAASTDLQLESELRRHRHHLARRLHHSREVSQSHHEAYERDPTLHNLLLDPYFTDIIAKTQHNWRVAVATAINTAWRCRPSARRSPISTAIARRVCLRICSRRSATSSARTPTSASTSRAFSHRVDRMISRPGKREPKPTVETPRRRVTVRQR